MYQHMGQPFVWYKQSKPVASRVWHIGIYSYLHIGILAYLRTFGYLGTFVGMSAVGLRGGGVSQTLCPTLDCLCALSLQMKTNTNHGLTAWQAHWVFEERVLRCWLGGDRRAPETSVQLLLDGLFSRLKESRTSPLSRWVRLMSLCEYFSWWSRPQQYLNLNVLLCALEDEIMQRFVNLKQADQS